MSLLINNYCANLAEYAACIYYMGLLFQTD